VGGQIFFYIFGGFGSLLFAASIICFIAWRPLGDPDPQVSNLALAVILLLVIALQVSTLVGITGLLLTSACRLDSTHGKITRREGSWPPSLGCSPARSSSSATATPSS
jgi:hypothetical protein